MIMRRDWIPDGAVVNMRVAKERNLRGGEGVRAITYRTKHKQGRAKVYTWQLVGLPFAPR